MYRQKQRSSDLEILEPELASVSLPDSQPPPSNTTSPSKASSGTYHGHLPLKKQLLYTEGYQASLQSPALESEATNTNVQKRPALNTNVNKRDNTEATYCKHFRLDELEPTSATDHTSNSAAPSQVDEMDQVVKFQKAAIYRHALLYKRKYMDASSKLSQLEKETNQLKKQTRAFSPYSQLMKKEIIWISRFLNHDRSSIAMDEKEEIETDEEKILLDELPNDLLSLMSTLFSKFHDILLSHLTSTTTTTATTPKANVDMVEDIKDRIVVLEKEKIDWDVEKKILNEETDKFRTQLEDLKALNEVLYSKIEKFKMASSKPLVSSSENSVKNNTTGTVAVEQPSNIEDLKTGKPAVSNVQNTELQERLETLNRERQETLSLCNLRLEEIENLTQANLSLTASIDSLMVKLSSYPSDFKPFVNYMEENTRLKNELDTLKLRNESQKKEFDEVLDKWKGDLVKDRELDEEKRRTIEELRATIKTTIVEKDLLKNNYEVLQNKLTLMEKREKENEAVLETQRSVNNVLKNEAELLQSRLADLEELLPKSYDGDKKVEELIARIKNDEGSLIKEIESIVQAYESSQAQYASLSKQLGLKDETYLRLYAEKQKLEAQLLQLSKSAPPLTTPTSTVGSTAMVSPQPTRDEIVIRLEKKERGLKEKCLTLEKELVNGKNQMEYYKRKESDALSECKEATVKCEHLTKLLTEAKAEIESKRKEISEALYERNRALESLSLVNNTLTSSKPYDRKRKIDDVDISLEDELRHYKNCLKCSVCNLADKNVALSRCMHTFCRPCLEKRLESRQRKCPTCSEPFGASDIRNIFW